MSNGDKKAKAVLVQIFAIGKDGKIEVGEDGSPKMIEKEYAFFEELKNVDYGCYSDINDGDAFVQLATSDGTHVSWHMDVAEAMGISGSKWKELVFGCGVKIEVGRFVEWAQDSCYKGIPCIVRVSGMAKVPEISADKTIAASDLSDAQKHEIKINGKPLFGNGDVQSGGLVMLRDDLCSMIDEMWSRYIGNRLVKMGFDPSGYSVHVVDRPSAVSTTREVEIKASGKVLENVLRALGCNDPSKVKIQHYEGTVDGDRMENTVCFVRLVIMDHLDD
jgi:hypothetical protein